MTRLVVDASVVVKWFLPEVLAEAALRIAEGDHRFLAPELLGAEFTSALWKKSRRGEIDTAAAVRMLDDFSRIAIAFHPLSPLLPTAFAIAAAAGHSVYDCLYLALAEREDCPIVTGGSALLCRLRWRPARPSHALGRRSAVKRGCASLADDR